MLTYEKYKSYRDRKGLNDHKVSILTGVGDSTFSDWKSNRYTPTIPTLLKIAKLLNIPAREIVSKEDISNTELNPKDSG